MASGALCVTETVKAPLCGSVISLNFAPFLFLSLKPNLSRFRLQVHHTPLLLFKDNSLSSRSNIRFLAPSKTLDSRVKSCTSSQHHCEDLVLLHSFTDHSRRWPSTPGACSAIPCFHDKSTFLAPSTTENSRNQITGPPSSQTRYSTVSVRHYPFTLTVWLAR